MTRVLVTGAAGFIGRHLVRHLHLMNYDVLAVDRADGDLRDPGMINSMLNAHKPDIVAHLAAKVGRLFGEDDVGETVADNTAMTAAVAKACGERGIRLAYASTSEVYGDRGSLVCSEDMALDVLPHNAYGMSKRHGEDYCRLYAPGGLTVWRLSMPYGPGLPPGIGRAAIVNMLWQAMRREPIPVHEGAERSWCWIGDTVRGMRMTLKTDGGTWNIGRDDQSMLMLDVARFACDLTGAPHSLIQEMPAPPRQTVIKRLDTSRLRSLGWEPIVQWAQGMELIYESLVELRAEMAVLVRDAKRDLEPQPVELA